MMQIVSDYRFRITEIRWSMTTRAATALVSLSDHHGAEAARKRLVLHFHSSSSSLYNIEFKYFYFWYVNFACFMLNI